MLNLEQVRHLLAERNIAQVSRESGLYYNTVHRIANGKVDPSYSVLRKLSDYLTGDTGAGDTQ